MTNKDDQGPFNVCQSANGTRQLDTVGGVELTMSLCQLDTVGGGELMMSLCQLDTVGGVELTIDLCQLDTVGGGELTMRRLADVERPRSGA